MAHIKTMLSIKTGKKSYRVFIKIPHKKTITKVFKKKSDAVKYSRTIEGNNDLKDSLVDPVLNQTFSEALKEYKHVGNDPDMMNRLNYFGSQFGQLKINQIKKSHVLKALNDLIPLRNLKPATQNRYKNSFGTFAKWITLQVDIVWKPHVGIAKFKEPAGREDYLTIEQQQRLLEQCKWHDVNENGDNTWRKMYLLVLMALSTGMRRGELLALKWSDIQWKDRMIIVRAEEIGASKTGKREVPIIFSLWSELQRHREIGQQGYIFASPYIGKPFEFKKYWYEVRQAANISDSFVFHSLRHTCASNMAKAGQSLMQIGVILGHKSAQTTLRYAHLVERETLHEITDKAMRHLS